MLLKAEKGELLLTLPGGEQHFFGRNKNASAVLWVHHWDVFSKIVGSGDIGLGEAFMSREWDSPNPAAVLEFLIENRPCFKRLSRFEKISGVFNRMLHWIRKNTVSGSKKNIGAHYDLSNDFFKAFLDESMTYSCAVFDPTDKKLEAAQKSKINNIINNAKIGPDNHVLEIGCGWGAFAIEAVRKTGCRVTGLTLSEEQFKLARARVREAGLEDKIEIRLCDYRNVNGAFDRIVSIEMLEAVGHDYFGEFFNCCDRLLKPDGIMALQVITIPDQRYDNYRRGCDFIQKYIFPGGLLPSLHILSENMTKQSALIFEKIENIGPHYATTLRMWYEQFKLNRARIQALGFDGALLRDWEYYFVYCEAGFKKRYLTCLQLVVTRSQNATFETIKTHDEVNHTAIQNEAAAFS